MGDSKHVHGAGCWEDLLSCGRPEHDHTSKCWDGDRNLCGRLEHSHSKACDVRTLTCPK